MKAGDAFFIKDRSVDTHLWVIVSDPERDAERVVLMSVTSFREGKDAACILDAGAHPRVHHKSCVAYSETRVTSLANLERLRDAGSLSIQPAVSSTLLQRIREGVSVSRTIDAKFIRLLLEQGAID